MFDNVGRKLQITAKVIFVLGMIGSIISGIALAKNSFVLCIILLACGIIGTIITSWIIYAIGETNENSSSSLAVSYHTKKAIETAKQNSNALDVRTQSFKGNARCPYCGKTVTTNKCENCGETNKYFE